MKFRSITFKLIFFVICGFFITAISVIFVADKQLTKIIDDSQNAMYTEKLNTIWETINRTNNRLQKTGLVEAYSKDFRDSVIKTLKATYYKQKNQKIYPVILNVNGIVVMHPLLSPGDTSLRKIKEVRNFIPSQKNSITVKYNDKTKWYTYKVFEPWQWVIAYAVPFEIKYADARVLRNAIIIVITVITLLVGTLLSLLIARFTRPIINLTKISTQIADGHLDQKINLTGNDEIALLAHSFDNMRQSIQKQISSLHHEIKERKRVEAELQYLQNYLSNIIDSMPSVLVGVDRESRVTQWNVTAEKITGISADAARGKFFSEVFSDTAIDQQQITQSIQTKSINRITNHTRKTKTGSKIENITVYPLITNGSEGVVIRIDDITKEHELEEQLHQSRKMDAIGQLAGGVAHDFNNMLAGIMGAAQLLQLPARKLDKKGLEYVNMILDASQNASDLTAKLMAFGRKENVASTPVDIHKIIDETLALLKRTIDKKIVLSVDTHAENHNVVGDNSALQNIFMNLGINAAHAMTDGGEITIETKNITLEKTYCDLSPFDISPGNYIEIMICDTGTGIPLTNLKKIFEPFFTTKKQGEGTGLGLAAVYGTIKNHRGAVTVYSEVGTGTVFRLYLPCSDKSVEKDDIPTELKKGSGLVLLVDDEKLIRITGQHMLEEMGYTVMLAENGQQAIQLFKTHHKKIDYVISDMIMPEMNGRETFFKMKEIDDNCKVIISSGFSKEDDTKELQEAGLVGFIQKPFSYYKLNQLLLQTTSPRVKTP